MKLSYLFVAYIVPGEDILLYLLFIFTGTNLHYLMNSTFLLPEEQFGLVCILAHCTVVLFFINVWVFHWRCLLSFNS